MPSERSGSAISALMCATHSSSCLGAYMRPVSPSLMRSGMPPARTATTGMPLDMASITTKPRVSDSEGMTNIEAEAYACDSSSPLIMPMKTTRSERPSFSKSALRSSSEGPPPTSASRDSGICLRMYTKSSRRFSEPSRPTYVKSGASGWPLLMRSRIAALLKRGLNTSTSMPFFHTSMEPGLRPPSATSVFFIWKDVTSVRSAIHWHRRMTAHMGVTRKANVYSGM
mmetsp:Transcript_4966/g.19812  ORF Transcript_4966/g.19812 Transcript_4966/m.19812 type:complete len:227 (+) Transcript_4966:311-991(+)